MLIAVPRAVLSLVLYSLPVGLIFAARAPLHRRKAFFLFAMGMLAVLLPLGWLTLRHLPNGWLAPFTYDSLGTSGFQDFVMMPGVRPVLLPNWLRAILTVLTFAVFLGTVIAWRAFPGIAAPHRNQREKKGAARENRDVATAPPAGSSLPLRDSQLLLLFGPYAAVYLLLYFTRAFQWDRYLLPLAFLAVLASLRAYQSRFGDGPHRWAWLFLLIVAGFDVAANHDVYALYRARLACADTLQRAGVPRTRFSAGFEYDAWTELQQTGYVKDPRLVLPTGLVPARQLRLSRQLTWSARLTPSVDAEYAVAFTLAPGLEPSNFAAVPYRTWLPPFHQQLIIARVR